MASDQLDKEEEAGENKFSYEGTRYIPYLVYAVSQLDWINFITDAI